MNKSPHILIVDDNAEILTQTANPHQDSLGWWLYVHTHSNPLRCWRSMKALLPKSLAGQTTLVLLTGLMFSHLISMLIFSSDRMDTLSRMNRHHVAQRVVSVIHLLSGLLKPSFQFLLWAF